MSRRSDIDIAEKLFWSDKFQIEEAAIRPVLEAAYDLGRAAQAVADASRMHTQSDVAINMGIAKRLRAKVRKLVEGR